MPSLYEINISTARSVSSSFMIVATILFVFTALHFFRASPNYLFLFDLHIRMVWSQDAEIYSFFCGRCTICLTLSVWPVCVVTT